MRAKRVNLYAGPGKRGKSVKAKALRSPCGKLVYTTRKLAAQQAALSSKQSGDRIEAYKCPNGCHGWHIGHPTGSRGAA